MSLTQGIAI